MITSPMPLVDVIGYLLRKEQLPAEWDSAMWRDQEPDFRTQAFWVSRVENARFVDRAQTLIFDYPAKVKEKVRNPRGQESEALSVSDREHFVAKMREFMIAEGMARLEDFKTVNQNDITDIRSLARLRLIFDTNVRSAYGYGQWKQGMTPAVLRAFPAARLIRERGVAVPRPRHQANLGQIMLKTDPRWAEYHNAKEIGGFEVPWGPYGFNSGVTQEDVSRADAKKAGLDVSAIEGERDDSRITDGTRASVRKMGSETKRKLLEELRGGPKPRNPEEAAKIAAARARSEMLKRGLADAEKRGDSSKAAKYKAALEMPGSGLRVRDDGDEISLNNPEIGSDHNKRGRQDPEKAQRAKARFIYNAIDKKAAAPQKNEAPSKLSNRSRQLFGGQISSTPEEIAIARSPHEILIQYDANGILQKATLGGPSSVPVPKIPESGIVYSHNHPQGKGPSAGDLKWILQNPESVLRVVARGTSGRPQIIQVRALTQLSQDQIREIASVYMKACNKNGDTKSARLEALRLMRRNFGEIVEIRDRNL